ncbi:MAG: flavin reductase family protein [Clostridia bacterium]|nr:flavin reductase family protein [Clostridia bacterium]
MRKNFGSQSWLYPMPVLIVGTYDENGNPNAMNAAWGGIYESDLVMVCLAHDHKTTDNIKKTGAFTLGFATEDTVEACDYVGIVSGNDDPHKFEKAGFHAEKSEFVNAPLIKELHCAVECSLLKFNEDGVCIGRIVNFTADSSVLNDEGKPDMKKLKPLVFAGASLEYFGVGEKVGQAFSDGEKLKR